MKLFKCMCSCFRTPVNQEASTPPRVSNREPIPAPSEDPKIIVESKFRPEDIKISEFTPANTQKGAFAYNCPICLRFFSTILTLQCCKQYICHFCIESLKSGVKFEVACPLCKAIPIHAIDVDLNSAIKKYNDSPYDTFKQSVRPGNKWVPMPIVKEDEDYDENQIFPQRGVEGNDAERMRESFEMPRNEPTRMHMTV